MHAISLQHVFKSDLSIRGGLGENLKSPKSPLGAQSYAWEAQGLQQHFDSLSSHPSPCGERASLTAAGNHFHAPTAGCRMHDGVEKSEQSWTQYDSAWIFPGCIWEEWGREAAFFFFFLLRTQVMEWVRGQGTGVMVLLHLFPRQGQGGWEKLRTDFPPPVGGGDGCLIVLREAPASLASHWLKIHQKSKYCSVTAQHLHTIKFSWISGSTWVHQHQGVVLYWGDRKGVGREWGGGKEGIEFSKRGLWFFGKPSFTGRASPSSSCCFDIWYRFMSSVGKHETRKGQILTLSRQGKHRPSPGSAII